MPAGNLRERAYSWPGVEDAPRRGVSDLGDLVGKEEIYRLAGNERARVSCYMRAVIAKVVSPCDVENRESVSVLYVHQGPYAVTSIQEVD